MKTVITILWGTILSLSITAQTQTVVDTYGTKTNQKENSRLNMALHAVFDGRNQPQTSFLIKAATHPTKEMESEVFVYFSGDDLKMFGKFDQFDISIYKASAHLGSTGERWAYLRGLSIPDRMRWWKIRIAEAIATEELSPDAVENLLDIAAAITPTAVRQTPDLIALSRAEGVAERVIGKEWGGKLFGLSIPGQPCKSVAIASETASCGCSNGSYFNSCTGCGDGGGCVVQDDGCGFLGFYKCDGQCGAKEIQ